MDDAYFPTEKACEPEENARQPTMNETKYINKTSNVTFKEVEEAEKSRSKRVYKSILSQPSDNLSQLQKMLWLQKRRTAGLWVQCNRCDRWRYQPGILDKFELPNKWFCEMNSDKAMADCSVPEVPINKYDEEDLIYSEYSAGSVVVARLTGWPWWPAMVDDDPDTEQFYWLDGFSDIPTHYNVVFFDTEVTRAWIAPDQLKPYTQNKSLLKTSLKKSAYKKRLEVGMAQADDAVAQSLEKRLEKYSFVNRYKETINTPIDITTKHAKKFQKQLKRKFNIDLPDNFFDSDDEDVAADICKDKMKKTNVIIVGSKRSIENETNNENGDINEELDTNGNIKKSSLIVQVGTGNEENCNEGHRDKCTLKNSALQDQRVHSNMTEKDNQSDNTLSLLADPSRPVTQVNVILDNSTNYNTSGSPHSDDFDF